MVSHKSDGPLFIIGSPRSGTSLLRLILTCHSQILVPPECGFIIWLYEKYGDWSVSSNDKRSRVNSFIDDLFQCKKFDTWFLSKDLVRSHILRCQPSDYAALCKLIYSVYAVSIQKNFTLWGDKNNFYLNHLEELQQLYKNARFLHIVRDGRDIACSYRKVMTDTSSSPYAPKLPTEIQDIAHEWASNVTKVDLFLSTMPSESAITITYEQLTLNPSAIIQNICNWLKLPFEAEMLDFYLANKRDKLEPELTIDWKKRTLQPIGADTVGRYTEFLTTDEQDRFLNLAESILKRFSYL